MKGLTKAKTMRHLLQSFEADREAGWPFWFSVVFSVILFLCLGVDCLKIQFATSWRSGAAALAVFLLAFCGGAAGAEQSAHDSAHDPATHAAAWSAVGPAGGDARAFATVPGQPGHLYLGTTNSWLYESLDAGANWHRLARLDDSDHLILDHIVVDSADSKTIFVAGWRDAEGGLWVSHDGGKSWREIAGLHGQSIRAFLQAPSDPKVLLAGTLEGVFRSTDAGTTWAEISPAGSREIHEVESLAVDPVNPDVIYAGTWHLPWKTEDGGKTWHNIKQGLIDDSDVFSIILDPERPSTVFLSACSGIYKSLNAGLHFRKIEGIPSTARRTRVLKQDPANREIVYAGTTEGLYKTVNGGRTFRRMTGPDVIVNDVFIDPRDPNHVLLATDRGGVLASTDGGATFTASNEGISERKVTALLVDRRNPARLYAGVANDKSYGGVFVSNDGGAAWQQVGAGLDGRDVFALSQTKDGTVLAGTSSGIFVLDPPAGGDPAAGASGSPLTWEPRNTIANTEMKESTETVRRTRVNVEKEVKVPVIDLESRVNALDVSSDTWLAATSLGLLTSRDQGASWQGGPVLGVGEYLSVTVHGDAMAAARVDGVVLSKDGGRSWWPLGLPKMLTRIHRVVFSPDGTLWLGAREGVYFSQDLGKTWLWMERLPFRDVDDLEYDATAHRVLVSSRSSDQIFSIDPKTMTWKWWDTGFRIALIRPAGDGLVAASLDDGVVKSSF
jgi:photosystem II stability/assembly factor-like uncharacterized protein